MRALSVEMKGPARSQAPSLGDAGMRKLALSHHGRRGLALTYVSAARNAQESKYRGRC